MTFPSGTSQRVHAGTAGASDRPAVSGAAGLSQRIYTSDSGGPRPTLSGVSGLAQRIRGMLAGIVPGSCSYWEVLGWSDAWAGDDFTTTWHTTAEFCLGPNLYPECVGELAADVDETWPELDFGTWPGTWPLADLPVELQWRATIWHMTGETVRYLSNSGTTAEVTRGLTGLPVAHGSGTEVVTGDNATLGSIEDGGTTFTAPRASTYTIVWKATLSDDGGHRVIVYPEDPGDPEWIASAVRFELRHNGTAIAHAYGAWSPGELYVASCDVTSDGVTLAVGDTLQVWALGDPTDEGDVVAVKTSNVSIVVSNCACDWWVDGAGQVALAWPSEPRWGLLDWPAVGWPSGGCEVPRVLHWTAPTTPETDFFKSACTRGGPTDWFPSDTAYPWDDGLALMFAQEGGDDVYVGLNVWLSDADGYGLSGTTWFGLYRNSFLIASDTSATTEGALSWTGTVNVGDRFHVVYQTCVEAPDGCSMGAEFFMSGHRE